MQTRYSCARRGLRALGELCAPWSLVLALWLGLAATAPAQAQLSTLSESFDVAPPAGWVIRNQSQPVGTTSWFQGNTIDFPPQSSSGYIAANYENVSSQGTISSWLLTPELSLVNGSTFRFWTRAVAGSSYPDRLQVRLSTAGASTNVGASATDVGDFTTLALEINPGLTIGGYPSSWTQYTVTVTGVPSLMTGRFAFRYFVTNGGVLGNNSDYIGIDEVVYQQAAVAPTVTTAAATTIGSTSAVLGGNVTAIGSAAVTQRGVLYSATNTTPAIGGTGVTQDANGTGAGTFSETVAGLAAGTTYYVRAYAINSAGTSYGTVQPFTTATTVTSIVRASTTNPTNAGSVSFTVTFASPVTGISISNFSVTTTGGLSGASISSLVGSGTTYTVNVNTGTGNGTLRLDLTSSSGISPTVSELPFTGGQPYDIDKTRPAVAISSTAGASGSSTGTAPIPFTVTFSENVSGFVGGDVTVTNGAITGNVVNGTSPGTVYTFTVTPTAGGPVTVNVPANVAQDAASNFNTAAAGAYSLTYVLPATPAPVVTVPANGSQLSTGTPTYSGTASASAVITVYVDGTTVGTTTASTAGSWTLVQPTALAQGSHTVYATAQLSGRTVSVNSNTNTFTVCPAPVATARPVALVLDANGSATLAATAVNNGSTANCGPATAGSLTLQKWTTGVAFGEVPEGQTLTLTAPAGARFVSVEFASYGTPTGSAGNYALSGCHATTSLSVVEAALLGQNTGSIVASNTTFGDPCVGTFKKLAVRATYAYPVGTPAAQLTYGCAEAGLNYAALLVTDAGGNTALALTTVTVTDNRAPAQGTLPAAPALALTNVPEATGYGVLYQLDMPANANFGALAAVPYTINNSSNTQLGTPARVAYFMELTNGSGTQWVWASMDNFASTLTQLGLPHRLANPVNWHQSVSNLNVFSNAGGTLATGTNLGTGRVEMWPGDYAQANTDNVPGASGSVYDFGDQATNTNGYGSFQVHNLAARQTVLAYNAWHKTDGDDVGIGNQVGGSGNPDWTFARNVGNYTVKSLYVLVPNTNAFTQPATVALGADGTATVAGSQLTTAAATDNCGVASITVSPNTFTCAQVGTPQTVRVTLTDASGNTATQSAVVTVTVPPTATTTWNGSASTTWTDCANWSYGKVPDAATNAIIPTGLSRYPSLSAGTVAVKDLTIEAPITLGSAATVQVNGNFAYSGTDPLGGTIAFVGTAATHTLGGTGTAALTNVSVNKTAGTVELQRNLTLDGTLTFAPGAANVGILNTGSAYRLTLGAAASLSETETSYVLGQVAVSRTLAAGATQPFGGIGLTLTPAAGSTAPGLTPVVRTTGTALTGVDNSVSILRNFDIQPATRTGLDVTMVFSYFEHELNAIPEANLVLFKSETGAPDTWANQRFTSRSAAANTVTKAGIRSFSIWTLGNSAAPLPVELTAFTATAEGPHTVRLAWATASEKNSARFEVERSLDGATFGDVATVQAAGSSSTSRTYTTVDRQLPTGASMLYYRLRQVDQDGTFSHSPVRAVALSAATPAVRLMMVPNPTTGATTLAGAKAGATVQVFDAVGRLVLTATADATGMARLVLPAGQPAGVYVVRSGTQATRLVLE
ncbi:choice-of-anchor J domain-containing protein [Microvirga sp. STR05]|uniref:Choice-of-anchor J domain-containing protein n=1 Tax=Hymenobacter duratus TaxID=2771356 RepID=A0ABR8JE29_9BACT|nr:choice-of-anchor J domain-containing protein [Hymenobacter duratus]MBD2713808.1 choice-of-anchor J domain-containing protein [Hymenobacter duratus]MBR7948710.1 choice-of-anchor J domain-containing protein [Microvirga sp. STR05]